MKAGQTLNVMSFSGTFHVVVFDGPRPVEELPQVPQHLNLTDGTARTFVQTYANTQGFAAQPVTPSTTEFEFVLKR